MFLLILNKFLDRNHILPAVQSFRHNRKHLCILYFLQNAFYRIASRVYQEIENIRF